MVHVGWALPWLSTQSWPFWKTSADPAGNECCVGKSVEECEILLWQFPLETGKIHGQGPFFLLLTLTALPVESQAEKECGQHGCKSDVKFFLSIIIFPNIDTF